MNASNHYLFHKPSLCDCWPSPNLAEIFERVIRTKKIRVSDRAALLAALANPTTPKEHLLVIDRLYWAARRGDVKIVDPNQTHWEYKPGPLKPYIKKDPTPELARKMWGCG